MPYELATLLDLLGSQPTGKVRSDVNQEVPEDNICWFEFVVKDIQPTHSVVLSIDVADAEGRKYLGGTKVMGELVDDRPTDSEEYLHDQNGQQIELFFPKWCNRGVSRWQKDEHVGCQGHLHGWDTASRRYQLLVTKVPFFSLTGTLLIYLFSAVFVWWWYFPLWLIYKLFYVAIPVGLAVWGVAAWQGNGELAQNAMLMIIFLTPLGLMLRFYVWAITLTDRIEESEQS